MTGPQPSHLYNRHQNDVYVNVNANPKRSHYEPPRLFHPLPPGRTATGRRPHTRRSTRRKVGTHALAVRTRPHQPLAAARPYSERVRARRRLDSGGLLYCFGRGAQPLGAPFRTRARRPPHSACGCHPHAPGPHRFGRLAVPALERTAVGQRDRLLHRRRRQPGLTRVQQ